MNKIAIIIPVRNGKDILKLTVDSIFNSVSITHYRIIIIESESNDGTAEYCDYLAQKYDKITIIHTKKEGITKAINTGIRITKDDEDILLTQNDVIFPKLYGRDWLENMQVIANNKDAGIITCLNGGGTSGQDYLENFNWVGTWCMYIPRNTINKVGVLDENFYPGPGDDIDYTFRVRTSGLVVYMLDFAVDHHRMGENFNDNLEFIKRKNAGYFRKKHNILPYWEEYEFEDEKYLLDYRTRFTNGCFCEGKIDDKETCGLINKILKEFKENDVFVDCGANTGFMSLLIKKGRAIAYEFYPKTFEILKNNAFLNREFRNVTVVNKALYSEEIGYDFLTDNRHQGMYCITLNEKSDKKTVILNKDLKLNENENIKLLKIDCEDVTIEVLKGASEIIKRFKPIIIIEEHDQINEELFKKMGYKDIIKNGINLLIT